MTNTLIQVKVTSKPDIFSFITQSVKPLNKENTQSSSNKMIINNNTCFKRCKRGGVVSLDWTFFYTRTLTEMRVVDCPLFLPPSPGGHGHPLSPSRYTVTEYQRYCSLQVPATTEIDVYIRYKQHSLSRLSSNADCKNDSLLKILL